MDKKIVKKRWTIKRILIYSVIAILVLILLGNIIFRDHNSKLLVESKGLVISEVEYNDFQEYISVIGIVKHKETSYIDAVQPGIIEKINTESGNIVKKGDVILKLTNSSLELNVITQESAIYYQLSTIRNSKLQLNQNNLNQLSQLTNFNYQLNLLYPQYKKYKIMLEKNLISQWEFDQVNEQYLMYKRQKELFLTTYYNDSISRVDQLKQIELSEKRMLESLINIRSMLDDLIVRAPINGQYNSSQLFKVGQTINAGDRIGQVDVLGGYVIRVNIDEHYLPDISTGQKGTFEFAGNKYDLIINKIYPTVINNNFQVDMNFVGKAPEVIKSGQNLQIRLELGNLKKALLIPAGGFYEKTGGNWVFLVDENKKTAVKRTIELGRSNPEYFEVLEGLNEGDKIITSSYDLLSNYDVLMLK